MKTPHHIVVMNNQHGQDMYGRTFCHFIFLMGTPVSIGYYQNSKSVRKPFVLIYFSRRMLYRSQVNEIADNIERWTNRVGLIGEDCLLWAVRDLSRRICETDKRSVGTTNVFKVSMVKNDLMIWVFIKVPTF